LSSKRFKSKSHVKGNDFCYLFIHADLAPYELVWRISQDSGIHFKCDERLFEVHQAEQTSEHVLYYFEGDEFHPRVWFLLNKGQGGSIFNHKPLPDYVLIWEKLEDFCYEDFWNPLFKKQGMSQMTYLYPDEKTQKIVWCFDLPYLIPKENHV
jgi:hypothetical protein